MDVKEYKKNWYQKNKERLLLKDKEYKKIHKEHINFIRKTYPSYGTHSINYKINEKRYRLKLKSRTFEALGNKCVRCGFSDYRALQIDHINGGGNEERKKVKISSSGFNIMVLRSFLRGENKYQLLCANCNWIKRVENNEVRKFVH